MTRLADTTAAERAAVGIYPQARPDVVTGGQHRAPTIDFEPLGSLVLIRPDAPESISAGGVLLPDAAQEKPCQGEVLACGPHCVTLKVGERVLFLKYTGTDVELEGETLLVVKESEVQGRFRPRLST